MLIIFFLCSLERNIINAQQTLAPSMINSGGGSSWASSVLYDYSIGEIYVNYGGGSCDSVFSGFQHLTKDTNRIILGNVPGCSLLPISLIEFKGIQKGNSNMLFWETATETNNSYFTLERLFDESVFNTIHKINGAGNSNMPLTYTCYDNSPQQGNNYYRLKQTDFNGDFSYSGIINIPNYGNYLFISSSYPNPTESDLSFVVHSQFSGIILIEIRNCLGQILVMENHRIAAGDSEIISKMQLFAKGIYSVRISSGAEIFNYATTVIKN